MISFTVFEGEGGGMCTCVRVSMEPEEGVGAPVTRVTVACKKHWKLYSDPSQYRKHLSGQYKEPSCKMIDSITTHYIPNSYLSPLTDMLKPNNPM